MQNFGRPAGAGALGKISGGEGGVRETDLARSSLTCTRPFQVRRRGVETRLLTGASSPHTDETLIRAVALSHAWLTELRAGTPMSTLAKRRNCTPAFIRQRLPLALLSPEITGAILAGRQPQDLTLTKLITQPIPMDWDAQWAELGFSADAWSALNRSLFLQNASLIMEKISLLPI